MNVSQNDKLPLKQGKHILQIKIKNNYNIEIQKI